MVARGGGRVSAVVTEGRLKARIRTLTLAITVLLERDGVVTGDY